MGMVRDGSSGVGVGVRVEAGVCNGVGECVGLGMSVGAVGEDGVGESVSGTTEVMDGRDRLRFRDTSFELSNTSLDTSGDGWSGEGAESGTADGEASRGWNEFGMGE